MNVISARRTWEAGDQAQLLATIDRWLERDVRPVVKEHDHADRWPAEIVEQMREFGLFGATVGVEYGGLGLPATIYAEIVMRISAVWMAITGIFNSHLMLALAIEKFGTAEQKQRWLPGLRQRGNSRRARAHRARRRHRPAGHPHDGAPRRRPLRHQWHQDLDLQRDRRLLLRAAGEDRSEGRAAPQGHEPVRRAETGRLPRRPQAGKARLQVDRTRPNWSSRTIVFPPIT